MYELEPQDLGLAYKETYVGFKKGDKLLPFFVKGADRSIEEDGTRLLLYGQLLENGEWKDEKIFYDDDNLQLHFPQIGVVNTANTVVFIGLRTKKQYKKTLTSNVIDLVDPLAQERKLLGMIKISGVKNKSILNKIFNPITFTQIEALNLVKDNKRLAAAFDSDYYWAIKWSVGKICLCKGLEIIGVLDNETIPSVSISKAILPLREQIESFGINVNIEGESSE